MDDLVWAIIGGSIGAELGNHVDDIRKGRNKVFAYAGVIFCIGMFFMYMWIQTSLTAMLATSLVVMGVSLSVGIRGMFLSRKLKKESLKEI